jgi:phenylpropionate dioxygenase-like ring-hydroxylating dioxygenase large terminal subunit
MKQLFFVAALLVLQYASGFTKSIQTIRPTLCMSTLQSETTINSVSPPTEIGNGAWLPILSIASHAGNDLPISIEVAGEKLVVWNNPKSKEWSVMQDACPHRQAPLSQGRVDPESGCIECPYHGQQFETTGACTKIPQSDTKIPAGTEATAFPVHRTNDLLWAFLPLPNGQASYYPTLPEETLPEIMDAPLWTVRDLPYSADFLVENFMDASHIPFAHHSLQAKRSDGSPVPMQLLTSLDDKSLIEVAFQDQIMGKPRSGVVSFAPPCYYHFRLFSFTYVTITFIFSVVIFLYLRLIGWSTFWIF